MSSFQDDGLNIPLSHKLPPDNMQVIPRLQLTIFGIISELQ